MTEVLWNAVQRDSGSTNGWARQVAVDGRGIPWARDSLGNIDKAMLDSNDMPTSWQQRIPAGGPATYLSAGPHRHSYLSPNFGAAGHVFGWSSDRVNPNATTPTDVHTPPKTFDRIAGALPYLWGVEPNGSVWYAR
jgi:hypothetical protein